MGMDVMHYRIKRELNQEEFSPIFNGQFFDYYNLNILTVELDQRMKSWYLHNYPAQHIRKYKEFDWHDWLIKFPQYDPTSEHYQQWELENSQLFGLEDDWIHFVRTTEIGLESEILKAEFIYKEKEVVFFEVKEVGYMRKPFRHTETPTKIENESIIITVTNFSGKGNNAYQVLQKISPEQTNNGNVFIFNIEELKELQSFSDDSEIFNKMLINDFDKQKDIVLFNW